MPLAKQDFAECSPDETFDRGVDFARAFTFQPNEYIVSADWLCEVHEDSTDPDASASGRKTGAASTFTPVGGAAVTGTGQRFTGMLEGVTYLITARVTTDQGQILELSAKQKCVARPVD